MLPAVTVFRRLAVSRRSTSSVVVVFPFVPVMEMLSASDC